MPSPFPGMNPYLEMREFWPEVHHLLIGILAETRESSTATQISGRYRETGLPDEWG